MSLVSTANFGGTIKEAQADERRKNSISRCMPTPEEANGGEARKTEVLPGWSTMDRVIRQYDEAKVKDYIDDVENLLVFAGLFSSVLTSFVIESYSALLPDTSKESLLVLQQLLAAQTAGQQFQGRVDSTAATTPSSSPFRPSDLDIRVNVLWFASLILTLIAAFFGIMVNQWLRDYMAFRNPSPQARLRVRHLRYPALIEWKVFEIAAFLPTLIHIALALFFVGLVYFTKSVHSSIEYTTLPLVSAWLFSFAVLTALPFFFPRCPYHITLLRQAYARTHLFVGLYFALAQSWIKSHCPDTDTPTRDDGTDPKSPANTTTQSIWSSRAWSAAVAKFLGDAARAREDVDEIKVTQLEAKDLEVLSEVDAIQSNDQLLVTEIADAVAQVDVSKGPPHAALKFIHRLLYNRQVALPQHDHETCYGVIIDLRKTALSAKVQEAIVDLASRFLNRHSSAYVSFADIAISQASSGQKIDPSSPRTISSNTLIPANLYVRFLFALLLCLSGRHNTLSKTTQQRLSPRLRASDIVVICQAVIVQSSPERSTVHQRHHISHRGNNPSNKTCAHLLHGLSILHGAVDAGWSLAQVFHSAWPKTIARMYSDSNATDTTSQLSGSTKPLLGSRAMHHVVSLESWTGALDRPVVKDILEGLCKEVEKYTCPTTRGESNSATSPDPTVMLDSVVTCICFLAWRPQWFRLEMCWSNLLPSLCQGKTSPSDGILVLAVRCIPTLGILRLCWRAASHSRPSAGRVIDNVDLRSILSGWEHTLRTSLTSPLASDPSHAKVTGSDLTAILKLLAFSVYLYTFGTPRSLNIPPEQQQAWAKVFSHFHTSEQLREFEVPPPCDREQCRHRTPWSALATVCLEMIRFEEILTRVLRGNREQPRPEQPHSSPRFDSELEIDVNLFTQWRSSPLYSVFPRELISALEKLAEPSWFESNDMQTPSVKFHNYCTDYEDHIRELVKIKAEDTWSWLHGYCSNSPR